MESKAGGHGPPLQKSQSDPLPFRGYATAPDLHCPSCRQGSYGQLKNPIECPALRLPNPLGILTHAQPIRIIRKAVGLPSNLMIGCCPNLGNDLLGSSYRVAKDKSSWKAWVRRHPGFHFAGKAIVPIAGAKTPWSAVAAATAFLTSPICRMNRRRKAVAAATALQGAARIFRLGGAPQAEGLWTVRRVDE